MRIAGAKAAGGGGLWVWRRSGKPLTLRLTPRELRRCRLETTRSCRISWRTASWYAALRRGGNGDEGREFAADHAHRVEEGETVGIFIGISSMIMFPSLSTAARNSPPISSTPDPVRSHYRGNGSPAGSCVWHVVGLQRSILEWAMRQGWGGKPVRVEQAQGILVAALGVLAGWYGYGGR